MQHPWWFPVRGLARHVLGNSTVLVLVASVFVFDSALLEFSGHLIHSKFVFHILMALGYAIVIVDAFFVGMALVQSVLSSLKRVWQ
jgi:hypothetical protein